MTDNDSLPPLSRGQFSLLGLLSFMLAWGLYFSAVAALWAMWRTSHPLPEWLGIVTFFFAWTMLGLLYWSWRVRYVLIVHCFGPIVAAVYFLLPMLAAFRYAPSGWHVAGAILWITSVICLGSLTVSLPVASLVLLYQVLTRRES
ncbi:MAG: hypothetical protein ACLQLG_12615 [Thermoguttaceae bacterium]